MSDYSSFYGLAALSPNVAYAVGNTDDFQKPAIERWDGTRWTVDYKLQLGDYGTFIGVCVVSRTETWAVGSYGTEAGDYAVIAHQVGGHWTQSSGLGLGGNSDGLYSVDALSSSDAWAVGESDRQGLIGHWNGANWSFIRLGTEAFTAVAAIAADDVWAVSGGPSPTAEHWDGHKWHEVSVPNPGGQSDLGGLSALASDDIWAVGDQPSSGSGTATLIEHWDGARWSVVPSPTTTQPDNFLGSVSADSPTDAWAVGDFGVDEYHADRSLTLHWDGNVWTRVLVH